MRSQMHHGRSGIAPEETIRVAAPATMLALVLIVLTSLPRVQEALSAPLSLRRLYLSLRSSQCTSRG